MAFSRKSFFIQSCLGNRQIPVFDGENALTSHLRLFVLQIKEDFRERKVDDIRRDGCF